MWGSVHLKEYSKHKKCCNLVYNFWLIATQKFFTIKLFNDEVLLTTLLKMVKVCDIFLIDSHNGFLGTQNEDGFLCNPNYLLLLYDSKLRCNNITTYILIFLHTRLILNFFDIRFVLT